MAQLYERQGSEFLVNTFTDGDQSTPIIAALSSGGFVVTWFDPYGDSYGGEIRAQLFDANRNKVGGEIAVATLTSNTQNTPFVAALASGGFVVSWTSGGSDGSGEGIKAQLFNAGGVKVGGEFPVNTQALNDQDESAITPLASGGFVVTWTDSSQTADPSGTGVKAQIFDATGARVRAEFLINTTTAGAQAAPAITALGSGFVAAWTSNSNRIDDVTNGIKAQRYDALGNKIGTEFSVNPYNNSFQFDTAITSLVSGGFVVTWGDPKDGIQAQVFDANGNKLGNNFKAGAGTQPAIASLPGGGFIITWNEVTSTGQGALITEVRAQIFDSSGNKEGTEFLINSGSVGINTAPTVAVLASGQIVVSFAENSSQDADPNGSGISAQAFAPTDGPSDIALSTTSVSETAVENTPVATFSAIGAVNSTFTYTLHSDSSLGAFRIDGDRLVVVDSDRLDFETAPEVSLVVRATDQNGNSYYETISLSVRDEVNEVRLAAGPEAVLNSVVEGGQGEPVLTALADGRFVTTWSDSASGGIKARILDSSGNPAGDEFAVKLGSQMAQQSNPSITSLMAGGFVIIWENYPAFEGQIFDPTGAPVGQMFQVGYGAAFTSQVSSVAALPSGGFVVTWDSQDSQFGTGRENVRGQIFDAVGTKVGGEFIVNTEISFFQGDSAIAVLASGAFVVSYTSVPNVQTPHDVKAQMFNASGSKLGVEFTVNTTRSAAQNAPAIAALENGGYVVSWTDSSATGGDTSGSAIRAQIFDPAGSRVGSEFLVNTIVSGTQQGSTIAALPGGGFVVGWMDASGQGGDSSGTGIRAQRFDAAGNRVGDEFLVNSVTAGSQGQPALAVRADGSIFVIWSGPDQSGASGTDIYGRLFSSSPGPQDQVIAGTPENDALSGGAGNDRLIGLAGSDTLDGGDGDDILVGGQGADTLIGGPGGDTADYSQENGGADVVVNLQSGGVFGVNGQIVGGNQARDTFGTFDSLSGIENVKTGGGNDSIYGNAAANRIETGAGNDFLLGGAGADILIGGDGNDVYSIRIVDSATFEDTINEAANGGTDEIRTTLASFSLASVANIENLTGLAATGQRLEGNQAANRIAGGFGSDQIFGGGADDILSGGGDGDDYIDGGSGRDTLFGGTGRDYMIGGSEGDVMLGDADGDIMFGGSGEDDLRGEAGDDYLDGGSERDILSGDAGRDDLHGGAGSDSLLGGADNDLLFGDDGDDDLRGGDGDDYAVGGGGRDSIQGDAGADTLYGGGDTDVIMGGGGEDFIFGEDGDDYADGGADRDVLFGGSGRDTLIGGLGSDSLLGGTDGDSLFGEDGDDEIRGGDGDDYAVGGSGGDYLLGDAGADTLYGGGATDVMIGGDGEDFIFGEDGDDYAEGGADRDVLFGGSGRDALNGGFGNDSVVGGADGDLLFGDSGSDRLEGESGDDYLDGGTGDDTLLGGTGADVLVGGEGADRFTFAAVADSGFGSAPDFIADFNRGAGDAIDLSQIDANAGTGANDAFSLIGSAAFSGTAGQLRYDIVDGRAHVFGDVNGDGAADLFFVVNINTIQAQDFVL